MKKFLSFILAIGVCYSLFIAAPAAIVADMGVSLSFVPADAVADEDGSFVYLSDRSGKKVYSINTQTFEQRSVTFDLMPESLYYKDGMLYVALCTQPHSSYWWDNDQRGAFAVIDCSTFTVTGRYDIAIDPYDIVLSNTGTVYIASGSGQWTRLNAYGQDGALVYESRIRQASKIEYNPVLNRVYTVTTDLSPRDISTYLLSSDGAVSSYYDSPYHGDYPMGTTIRVSPDGAYILNNSGNVFTCNAVKESDMRFHTSLNKGWTDLVFNTAGTAFYAVVDNSKQIYAYNCGTFEGTATYETIGYPQYLFMKGNTLTAVSKETLNGSVYFIETIDLSAPQTTIEMTITTNPLLYADGKAQLSVRSNAKTVFNGDMMYVADGADHAIYAIDTLALTETKITFANPINSLYYDNGELIVGFGSSGVVAILDATTFAVKERLVLGAAFYDVAIGKDGFIYIIENFGSSAFSYARSYSRASGQQISSASVYPRNGKFIPHPIYSMFYWADTGVSPPDVNALVYADGEIKAAYDSPYHGQYNIGLTIRISPDGANIFTSAGSVFRSSSSRQDDLVYKNAFTPFADLVFDLPDNQMFAAQSRTNLVVYDYTTYAYKGFVKTVYPVKDMTMNGGDIIALSSENNIFYLEILDSTAILQVAPEKITVSVADSISLIPGRTVNLNPIVVYNDGTSKSVTNTATYTSSDEAVATVNASGRLEAKNAGDAIITIESDGLTKTIDVHVDAAATPPPGPGSNMPFLNEGVFYVSGGWVYLTVWIEDNPNYSGVMPSEFMLVVQLMSMDGEPISISATSNTRYLDFSFKEEYFAVVSVVDRFGQQGYIGVQLAEPKRT